MTEYVAPDWGQNGQNVFEISLDVIKGGVVIESLGLPIDSSKSFVVVGRMDPLCDLVLQHPSISRTHAVLQFDTNGALFLMDLKSTHGTFVNKRRLDPMDYKRLHIGDVLAFGESTRLYAVCGPSELLPEEYESANLRQVREKWETRRQQREKRKFKGSSQEDSDDGISWGFREDAEEEEENSDEDSDGHADSTKASDASSSRSSRLPAYLRKLEQEEKAMEFQSRIHKSQVKTPKDKQLYERIEKKMQKLHHLRRETQRILNKQNMMELSENQQKQVDRNESRAQELECQLEQMEEEFLQRQHVAGGGTGKASRHATGAIGNAKTSHRPKDDDEDFASDEDEFYDRTKNAASQQKSASTSRVASTGTTGAALTVDMIERNVQQVEKELELLREEERQHLLQHQQQQEQEGEDCEEEDELDSFIQSTRDQLESEWQQTHRQKMHALEQELARQKQLLQVARPALDHMSQSQSKESKPLGPMVPPHPEESMAKELIVEDSKESGDDEQPPSALRPQQTQQEESRKRKVLATAQTESASATIKKNKPTPMAVPGSTGSQRFKMAGPVAHAHKPAADKRRAEQADGNVLEGGDRVWIPPANQTGDGRTALNDKFGY